MKDIKSEYLRDLYQYWHGNCAGKAVLPRDRFDPVDIPRLLSRLILLDVIDQGQDFRYRVVGTDVVGAIGRDFTGERLTDYHKGHEDISVINGYKILLETGEPQLETRSLTSVGRDYVTYERLLLPMARNSQKVDTILAGLEFHLPRDRTP
ncbi:PAS domain-containing protein [Aestuariispira ectoiniformans]|uniref:PAS domain-containing protein n=1 Tax=Aestuariispira ectoiniformans TaxID=2775080 RepID=UPI00223BCDDE|nr:PAS domain-containing protein [Aestuariispira ectoiniformans]